MTRPLVPSVPLRRASRALAAGCALTLGLPQAALAQRLTISETIVVQADENLGPLAAFETRHDISAARIAELNATTLDELTASLPAVQIPVNSRGEAIAVLRSASERQLSTFFEGASLNIPWDNRLDLSLLPAGLVGRVQSAAGPLAPHYGVNALGAISFWARNRDGGSLAHGTGNLTRGTVAIRAGPALLGGGYSARDGIALARGANLPHAQDDRDLRTNTDRRLGDVFAHFETDLAGQDLRVTAFHVWGDKGIAPEGNVTEGARHWRYNGIAHTVLTANLHSPLGPATTLDSTGWVQRFDQDIVAYAEASYTARDSLQADRDRTWGLRELLQHSFGAATFEGSFNFLQSTHRQRDADYDANVLPAGLGPTARYTQRTWSLGGELEYAFGRALRAELGVGYDVVEYRRTGAFPRIQDVGAWSGRAALLADAGGGWTLRAALGRKTRSATMRELFGSGINRFLANEDLRPETIVSAELGAEWTGGEGSSFYLVPFLQDLDDTIDQHRVDGLRQRINLPGSQVKGLEAGGNWQASEAFALSGNLTWTRTRRKDPPPGQINRLAERPALLATMTARYTGPAGIAGWLRARHIGRAWSADADGTLVPLGRATTFDLQASYTLQGPSLPLRLFVNLANLTDEVVTPQLGLPGPGRTLLVGFKVL
ncbi:TonB-dependent receptor [Novosphingobium profundi]|uniref:TonB-dependent receptor n=1 Tax=Novosphingobium profundi TaxID=1774954 RepID=UPI001CFED671|nr:TonB-dependent receptor [Novosphingobium profundi]